MFLTVLAACEHEPPPKKAPPAPPAAPPAGDPTKAQPTPPPPPTPTPPPPPPPNANQPPADAAIDAPAPVSQDCVDVASHIAETMIKESKDPQQKAFIEQEKTKIIRRSAEACTRDNWKPEILACFKKSTTTEQMQVCAKDLAPPVANDSQGP